ncbi:unnamed protein product, partial [Ectocarpus fasciculatus]
RRSQQQPNSHCGWGGAVLSFSCTHARPSRHSGLGPDWSLGVDSTALLCAEVTLENCCNCQRQHTLFTGVVDTPHRTQPGLVPECAERRDINHPDGLLWLACLDGKPAAASSRSNPAAM